MSLNFSYVICLHLHTRISIRVVEYLALIQELICMFGLSLML